MTDRINAFIVVLERDIRDDDCQPLIDAIMQFKGVISVNANVVDINSHISIIKAENEIRNKLIDILYPLKRD